MKQILTQQNEGVGDDLFPIYFAEVEKRGKGYFNKLSMMPAITGGTLPSDTIPMLLGRLAINPSLFSLILTPEPRKAIEDAIYGEDNDVQRRYITDFLDEVTLNVRLRNPELYDRNNKVLLDQLNLIVTRQTVMDKKQLEIFKSAFNFFEPLLLTLHYLRKIGYTHELRDIRSEV